MKAANSTKLPSFKSAQQAIDHALALLAEQKQVCLFVAKDKKQHYVCSRHTAMRKGWEVVAPVFRPTYTTRPTYKA